MSVVEDSRTLLQDLVAPELRAISARLHAVDRRLDAGERRFDDSERRAEKRHDDVIAAIPQVIDWSSVQPRLTKLEARDTPHQ